jgi:hypothetical protein
MIAVSARAARQVGCHDSVVILAMTPPLLSEDMQRVATLSVIEH